MPRKKAKFAPRKLVCLETYWSDGHARAFGERSVRPFFEGMASQFEPQLRVAHRFVESLAQLAAYTRRDKGLLWRDPEAFDAPVFYLSFHGSPGRIHTSLAKVGPARLCDAFRDWGRGYDNLVYFRPQRAQGRARQPSRRISESVRCAPSPAMGLTSIGEHAHGSAVLRRLFASIQPTCANHQSIDDFAPRGARLPALLRASARARRAPRVGR
jgi:hypothetical protein